MTQTQKIMVVIDRPKKLQSSPDDDVAACQAWLQFADSVQESTKLSTKGRVRLGENVWLLDADGALPSICEMIRLASLVSGPRLECRAFLVSGDVVELSAAAPRTASVQPLSF
jgi:hypothetical protein